MKTFFLFFWSSPPNLRAKSMQKKDNIGFGAKYSPDRCRIPNSSGLGCATCPLLSFCAPPQTHYSGSVPGTILFYSQCTINTVVCDQTANKSASFVLLNASILRKYRGKRLCDLQVFSNLSNYNYCIFVNEILLEIGFIEIGFIGSNWPATRPHFLFNFD